jgi:DNA-binding MarR family transcriptional regulator
MRQAVRDLDKGEGVSYADLEKHLLENFTPSKSQGYGPSYIKAYVRDGVNKYGHLSHENGGHEYSAVARPEPKTAAPKVKKLTKAQQADIDALNFIRTRGEVADTGDLDNTQITLQDFVTETGKKTKTVEKQINALSEAGFVRTETRPGNEGEQDSTYVFLTPAGLSRLQEVESQDTGEATAATGSDGGEA